MHVKVSVRRADRVNVESEGRSAGAASRTLARDVYTETVGVLCDGVTDDTAFAFTMSPSDAGLPMAWMDVERLTRPCGGSGGAVDDGRDEHDGRDADAGVWHTLHLCVRPVMPLDPRPVTVAFVGDTFIPLRNELGDRGSLVSSAHLHCLRVAVLEAAGRLRYGVDHALFYGAAFGALPSHVAGREPLTLALAPASLWTQARMEGLARYLGSSRLEDHCRALQASSDFSPLADLEEAVLQAVAGPLDLSTARACPPRVAVVVVCGRSVVGRRMSALYQLHASVWARRAGAGAFARCPRDVDVHVVTVGSAGTGAYGRALARAGGGSCIEVVEGGPGGASSMTADAQEAGGETAERVLRATCSRVAVDLGSLGALVATEDNVRPGAGPAFPVSLRHQEEAHVTFVLLGGLPKAATVRVVGSCPVTLATRVRGPAALEAWRAQAPVVVAAAHVERRPTPAALAEVQKAVLEVAEHVAGGSAGWTGSAGPDARGDADGGASAVPAGWSWLHGSVKTRVVGTPVLVPVTDVALCEGDMVRRVADMVDVEGARERMLEQPMASQAGAQLRRVTVQLRVPCVEVDTCVSGTTLLSYGVSVARGASGRRTECPGTCWVPKGGGGGGGSGPPVSAVVVQHVRTALQVDAAQRAAQAADDAASSVDVAAPEWAAAQLRAWKCRRERDVVVGGEKGGDYAAAGAADPAVAAGAEAAARRGAACGGTCTTLWIPVAATPCDRGGVLFSVTCGAGNRVWAGADADWLAQYVACVVAGLPIVDTVVLGGSHTGQVARMVRAHLRASAPGRRMLVVGFPAADPDSVDAFVSRSRRSGPGGPGDSVSMHAHLPSPSRAPSHRERVLTVCSPVSSAVPRGGEVLHRYAARRAWGVATASRGGWRRGRD
jgi:hypothetical protein